MSIVCIWAPPHISESTLKLEVRKQALNCSKPYIAFPAMAPDSSFLLMPFLKGKYDSSSNWILATHVTPMETESYVCLQHWFWPSLSHYGILGVKQEIGTISSLSSFVFLFVSIPPSFLNKQQMLFKKKKERERKEQTFDPTIKTLV